MCCLIHCIEIVEILLRHDLVLQQVLRTIQLQVGSRRFDLCLLIVRPGLLQVSALQHADDLALGNLLTGEDLQRKHAPADRRIDVHHRRRIRLNARSKRQLIVHRLDVRNHGVHDAVLRRRRVGCIGWLAALAAAEKEEHRGSQEKGADVAKLSWNDLRSGGKADLMQAEPNLHVRVQRIQVHLPVVLQGA